MKIFLGGFAAETNVYGPIPTAYEDFLPIGEGPNVIDSIYQGTVDTYQRLAQARGWGFAKGLLAAAIPSGTTTRVAHQRLKERLLDDLGKATPVDIVFLFLHGADGCKWV